MDQDREWCLGDGSVNHRSKVLHLHCCHLHYTAIVYENNGSVERELQKYIGILVKQFYR